jgi:hypothetical protein
MLCLGAAGTAEAQRSGTALVGVFVEHNYSTQPGVQVSYSSPRMLGGAPRLAAAYSTTRLATALGSNALVEDRLQAAAGWYFRRDRTISPHVTASVGYARFDVDDDDTFALLDSGAPFVSLLLGAEAALRPALRLSGSVGYSPLQSSTVYPLVTMIGLHLVVHRGGR